MSFPTIEELKNQTNIDHDEDDNLLSTYADAAKITIENYLNRKLYDEKVPDNDVDGMKINNAIKVAIMMLVAHWYDNREAVIIGSAPATVPLAYATLIKPYRIIPI